MTTCAYNTIKENACEKPASQTFSGLDLCEQHYKQVIEAYNDIVQNDREIIRDEKGQMYKVNKDKLV